LLVIELGPALGATPGLALQFEFCPGACANHGSTPDETVIWDADLNQFEIEAQSSK
jgi:hypothetical protein